MTATYSASWAEGPEAFEEENIYLDILDALKGIEDWGRVPWRQLSPRDVSFLRHLAREGYTPQGARDVVLQSRVVRAYKRALQNAVALLVGRDVLSENALEEYNLERVYVLAEALAYAECNAPAKTGRLRRIRRNPQAAEDYIRLWVRLAVPGRPIGSSWNPSPTAVAYLAANKRVWQMPTRHLAAVAEYWWLAARAAKMRRRSRILALGRAAYAFQRAEVSPYYVDTGDLVRIGRIADPNARIVAAYVAYEYAQEASSEEMWEAISRALRRPYWALRNVEGVRPGTHATRMWPKWDNVGRLLRGLYALVNGDAWLVRWLLGHASPRVFDALATAWGEVSEDDLVYLAAFAVVFNKRTAREYLSRTARAGIAPHDAAQPIAAVLLGASWEDWHNEDANALDVARALGGYLLRWTGTADARVLTEIARGWKMLSADGIPPVETPPQRLYAALVAKASNGGKAMATPLLLHRRSINRGKPA